MSGTATWILCVIGGYLVGAVPFGVLIGRARGIDIRDHGSRNIGAANVTRVLGRPFGILCFILDGLKGAGPVLIAGSLTGVFGREPHDLSPLEMFMWLGVAASSVIGHMFSPYLGFRGGKGIATGFGSVVVMWPLMTYAALASLLVWYVALRVTKYISVAGMLAALSLPISYVVSIIPHDMAYHPAEDTMARLLHASPPFFITGAIALLVIYQHRENLSRLRRGEEPKIGGLRRHARTVPKSDT